MATWPRTNKSVTIPCQMIPKKVLKYIVEQVAQVTANSVTWEQIKEEL